MLKTVKIIKKLKIPFWKKRALKSTVKKKVLISILLMQITLEMFLKTKS
jgi:hypothetical protein